MQYIPEYLIKKSSDLIKRHLELALSFDLDLTEMPTHISYHNKEEDLKVEILLTPYSAWMGLIDLYYPSPVTIWQYDKEKGCIVAYLFNTEVDFPISYTLSLENMFSDPENVKFNTSFGTSRTLVH